MYASFVLCVVAKVRRVVYESCLCVVAISVNYILFERKSNTNDKIANSRWDWKTSLVLCDVANVIKVALLVL